MSVPLGRVIVYTRKIDEMVRFYRDVFGFREIRESGDRIVELRPDGAGAAILLHPAGKGQRQGQAQLKLVFDVPDVEAFCLAAAERGASFGPIHAGDGYVFSNAKDPAGNSVSVSGRAFTT